MVLSMKYDRILKLGYLVENKKHPILTRREEDEEILGSCD